MSKITVKFNKEEEQVKMPSLMPNLQPISKITITLE